LVDLWCPLTSSAHVLVGHVLPVVVLAMIGASVGPTVLGLRARRSLSGAELPVSIAKPQASSCVVHHEAPCSSSHHHPP
jgi:hypothetical protein